MLELFCIECCKPVENPPQNTSAIAAKDGSTKLFSSLARKLENWFLLVNPPTPNECLSNRVEKYFNLQTSFRYKACHVTVTKNCMDSTFPIYSQIKAV